jgi:peroxiredoxin
VGGIRLPNRDGMRLVYWDNVRPRLILGATIALIAVPLLWFAATRPIATPGAASGQGQGQGGAVKGVGPLPDHEAPNFTLKDPAGKTVELKQYRGRPVLLNFWATWCLPCREEMPEMEQLYRRHRDDGKLVVLAVSIDTEQAAKDVPEYLKEGDPKVGSYTFPVALDTRQEVARAYRLGGVPASYFIDAAGVIRAVRPGAMDRALMIDLVRTIFPAVAL